MTATEPLSTSIEKIADHLYLITLPMPFRLRPVNIVALADGEGITLFDTGLNLGGTFGRFEEALGEIGRSVHDIEHIFITHYHADHCGLAGKIKEISGAAIHMSETGKQILDENQDQRRVGETVKSFYTKQGIAEETVHAYLIFLRYFRRATVPFEVDAFLDFSREYRIGDTVFEVIPSPGHARDHVCYYFRNEGILLSGDHILPDSAFNLRPDLFCPGFRPAQAMLDSLACLEDLPVARVLPAHGSPFSDLKPVVSEMKRHYEDRKRGISRSLTRGGATASRISEEVFGSDLPGFDRFLALNETYAHLIELRHEGIAEESRTNGNILYRLR